MEKVFEAQFNRTGVGSRCDRPATAQAEHLEQARAELTGPPLEHSRTGIRTFPTEVDVDGFSL